MSAADQSIHFVVVLHVGDFCESPVEYHDFAVVSDHDVCRLHVAMNDALIVGKGEALSALDEDIENERQWVLADRVLITFCDAVKNIAQIPALQFFHREVGIAFRIPAEFVDGDGAGVRNLRCDAGFSEEAFLIGFEVLELRLEGFHDHGASEVFIDACAQDGFAPLSEGFEIPVPHEAVSDVLGKVPIGIGHQNIIGQDNTSSGNLKAATVSGAGSCVGLKTCSAA